MKFSSTFWNNFFYEMSFVLTLSKYHYILTTLNGKFLQGAPPIEVYRASIENEVCWPAFATEKGSSWAKHEVGCELTSAARECSRQTSVLRGSVALWGCSRPANWVFNKLWQPQLGELPWENLPLSVVWDFTVDYCNLQTLTHQKWISAQILSCLDPK